LPICRRIFQQHATAFLLAELLELHDRNCFERLGCRGARTTAARRARLGKAFDRLGELAEVIACVVADGRSHTLHICPKGSGMTSLLEPDPEALAFFNQFPVFGAVERTEEVATRRLDDLWEMPPIDFLKMDVQGAKLMVLRNGWSKLADCVAIQTEASLVPLYKGQPTFAAIDIELRRHGFIPHRFRQLKCWSIAPTMRNNDPRLPSHQLQIIRLAGAPAVA